MGKGGGTFDRLLGTLMKQLLGFGVLANDESRYDVFQCIVLTDVGLWLSGQLANFPVNNVLLLRGLNWITRSAT